MAERSTWPEVAGAREVVVHLLRQNLGSRSVPVAVLGLADEYLRWNPDDAEIRELRARWGPVRESGRAEVPE